MYNLRFQYTDSTSYWYTFDFVYKQCKDKESCIREEKLASLKVYLDREDNSLVVYDKSTVTFGKFNDVIITELNDAAKSRLGPALPLSDPNTADIAIDAIKNQNPAYCVYENEFDRVNIGLDKVIDNIYNFNKESFQEDRYYYYKVVPIILRSAIMQNNPTDSFTEADIKKKFHWLIDSGFTIDKAAETIKEQTDMSNVIKYIDNYLKQEKI